MSKLFDEFIEWLDNSVICFKHGANGTEVSSSEVVMRFMVDRERNARKEKVTSILRKHIPIVEMRLDGEQIFDYEKRIEECYQELKMEGLLNNE